MKFARVARPMAPVLDLSGAVPDRLVSYTIQRRPVQPMLDLSPKVEAAPTLQTMSTPELGSRTSSPASQITP